MCSFHQSPVNHIQNEYPIELPKIFFFRVGYIPYVYESKRLTRYCFFCNPIVDFLCLSCLVRIKTYYNKAKLILVRERAQTFFLKKKVQIVSLSTFHYLYGDREEMKIQKGGMYQGGASSELCRILRNFL